jgi:single-strand DNA-binding protein
MSLNKAIIQGRLTDNPELRHTASDISICNFTLAVDRYVKAGAEKQADFIKIICWRQTAEFASKYFCKGQLILVDGSIQTGSYTDNQGNKKYTFEVVADHCHFCEGKKSNNNSNVEDVEQEDVDFEEIDSDLPF